MRITLKILLCGLLVLCSLNASAKLKKGVKIFVSMSPMGSFNILTREIRGRVVKKGDVFLFNEIAVPVKSLDTGIELRNDYLQKRMRAEKYPLIHISNGKASGEFGSGELTMKGVKRKIDFRFEQVNQKFVAVNFILSLKAFKISGVNYNGLGVDDKVEVNAILPYITL